MKRKAQPKPETIIESVIFDSLPLVEEKLKPAIRCAVCGGDTTADAVEQLCWVCRRLKISAWRDTEQQMPAQE